MKDEKQGFDWENLCLVLLRVTSIISIEVFVYKVIPIETELWIFFHCMGSCDDINIDVLFVLSLLPQGTQYWLSECYENKRKTKLKLCKLLPSIVCSVYTLQARTLKTLFVYFLSTYPDWAPCGTESTCLNLVFVAGSCGFRDCWIALHETKGYKHETTSPSWSLLDDTYLSVQNIFLIQ